MFFDGNKAEETQMAIDVNLTSVATKNRKKKKIKKEENCFGVVEICFL